MLAHYHPLAIHWRKSFESQQTNDFMTQTGAFQEYFTPSDYLIRFYRVDGESEESGGLGAEDGLAYTSFPVQQRWNLKCYRIDINR